MDLGIKIESCTTQCLENALIQHSRLELAQGTGRRIPHIGGGVVQNHSQSLGCLGRVEADEPEPRCRPSPDPSIPVPEIGYEARDERRCLRTGPPGAWIPADGPHRPSANLTPRTLQSGRQKGDYLLLLAADCAVLRTASRGVHVPAASCPRHPRQEDLHQLGGVGPWPRQTQHCGLTDCPAAVVKCLEQDSRAGIRAPGEMLGDRIKGPLRGSRIKEDLLQRRIRAILLPEQGKDARSHGRRSAYGAPDGHTEPGGWPPDPGSTSQTSLRLIGQDVPDHRHCAFREPGQTLESVQGVYPEAQIRLLVAQKREQVRGGSLVQPPQGGLRFRGHGIDRPKQPHDGFPVGFLLFREREGGLGSLRGRSAGQDLQSISGGGAYSRDAEDQYRQGNRADRLATWMHARKMIARLIAQGKSGASPRRSPIWFGRPGQQAAGRVERMLASRSRRSSNPDRRAFLRDDSPPWDNPGLPALVTGGWPVARAGSSTNTRTSRPGGCCGPRACHHRAPTPDL